MSSNYTYDLRRKTWELIRRLRSGTAVFTMPAGPIKCAGAPQKIAYLAADYWRQQGVLDDIRVVLVLPTPGMFGVQVFADELERVVRRLRHRGAQEQRGRRGRPRRQAGRHRRQRRTTPRSPSTTT